MPSGKNAGGEFEALMLEGSASEDGPEKTCEHCGQHLAADAVYCQKCGAQQKKPCLPCSCCCCCCSCCLILVILLVVLTLFATHRVESWLAAGASKVLSATLGVPVSLGSVHFGLWQGRASISDLAVPSPQGYQRDFLDLTHLALDLSPASLLMSRLLGSSTVPIELEEISVRSLQVFIEKPADSEDSNAKTVVAHVNEILKPTGTLEENIALGLHALTGRIQADRIEFRDISISVCIHPMCDNVPPILFVLREFLITNVGKKGKGVFLYQLVELLVKTLLMAIIKAAPENLRINLMRAVGAGIKAAVNQLDYEAVHFRIESGSDSGSQETHDVGYDVGELSGWVAAQFDSLPLKASNLGVELNTGALKAQTALTNAAVSTQAKANLEATKLGAEANLEANKLGAEANFEANKLGAEANLEANKLGAELTGAGIKANTALTGMGIKANTAFNNAITKLRNGFTTGFTSGLR
eukprot:TRINITY_DN6147_c1_g2_i1.p1 TRINITY_DN6147_c1_g2~~TRINITY_DN6147_c1_g2_i1.p1  ORF type:complete len:471 (+),score=99.19 TRINITY_DN6147_c1_g2_i1:63-1475(+)